MFDKMLRLAAFAMLLGSAVFAQYMASALAGGQPADQPGTNGSKGLAGTFHGVLKEVSGKEIVIQSGDQTISIRRSHKTKFVKDGHAVKPSAIATDTPVLIDATEDIDLKPVALTVTVDSPKQGAKDPQRN